MKDSYQFAQIRLILHMLRNTENVFCRAAHQMYYVLPISTKTIIPVNFKVYGHTFMFTGKQLLWLHEFVSLIKKPIQRCDQLLKERICSYRSNSFSKLTTIQKRGKTETSRITSPESTPN